MCLEEYRQFTFTDLEAFGRAIKQIKAIINSKEPYGSIFFIGEFRTDKLDRKTASFHELIAALGHGIFADEYEFHGWKEFRKLLSKPFDWETIFGEIWVKIR